MSYPQAALNKAWELVCLNQFHDIIPGSSIAPVYVESQQQYEEVRRLAEEAISGALDVLAPAGAAAILVNPTSFPRRDPAFLPDVLPAGKHLARAGRPVAVQPTAGGAWIDAGELAPYSLTALEWAAGASPAPVAPGSLLAAPALLENDFVRVEFDAAGDITRLYDKVHRREVLPAGAVANQFQAFEDRPLNWDAWDVDIFLDDKMWTAEPAHSITVVEAGPLRATLEVRRRILNSEYTQRISLSHNSPQLDVATTIDWRERHIFLKVAFPVDVLSPTATYEIQWGNTERPTHRNTSWDWARFETCAQKWVDLSEGGYGVSLLNDCKYGHDIRDNVIRLSLLRGPTQPDPTADLGEHRFAYSLLPHAGRWDEATVAAAYALNDPILARWVAAPQQAPVQVAKPCPGPPAQRGGGDRQARRGRRRAHRPPVRVSPHAGVGQADVRLPGGGRLSGEPVGRDARRAAAAGNEVTYSIRPYEIVTLRIVPA